MFDPFGKNGPMGKLPEVLGKIAQIEQHFADEVTLLRAILDELREQNGKRRIIDPKAVAVITPASGEGRPS